MEESSQPRASAALPSPPELVVGRPIGLDYELAAVVMCTSGKRNNQLHARRSVIGYAG